MIAETGSGGYVFDCQSSARWVPFSISKTGRSIGAGAPLKNQNRTTHGFYSLLLTREEAADLRDMGRVTSLDQEIECARIALRRVMRLMVDPSLAGDLLAVLRLAHLAFSGTRTLARLVRDQSSLGGIPDELTACIHQTLDEIGENWGIGL